eukprot:1160108-Pelagomonas_calceolata.AAC.6
MAGSSTVCLALMKPGEQGHHDEAGGDLEWCCHACAVVPVVPPKTCRAQGRAFGLLGALHSLFAFSSALCLCASRWLELLDQGYVSPSMPMRSLPLIHPLGRKSDLMNKKQVEGSFIARVNLKTALNCAEGRLEVVD